MGIGVMANANHDPIEDSRLLLPLSLCDNIPLARDGKIWALCHSDHGGLKGKGH